MHRIQSVGEYRSLIKATKVRLGRVVANCTQIPRQMEPYIVQGRLTYEEQENGLLVWLDEGMYQTLYVWCSPQSSRISCTAGPRPVVLEMMGRSDGDSSGELVFDHIMKASGFARERCNLQFVCPVGNDDSLVERAQVARKKLKEASNLVVKRCETEELASRVIQLWEERLGIADIPLDHRNFLQNGDTVLCALDEAGALAGAYWWSDAGNRFRYGRHIVTDTQFVRRGVASALMLCAMADGYNHGINSMSTWISDRNLQSIALHTSLGFEPNDRICIQYVMPTGS